MRILKQAYLRYNNQCLQLSTVQQQHQHQLLQNWRRHQNHRKQTSYKNKMPQVNNHSFLKFNTKLSIAYFLTILNFFPTASTTTEKTPQTVERSIPEAELPIDAIQYTPTAALPPGLADSAHTPLSTHEAHLQEQNETGKQLFVLKT